MGKNRDLAKLVSSQTFRTIVVAGAMLGSPIVIGCGGGNKPKPVVPTNDDSNAGNPNSNKPDPAADQKAADEKKAADDKAAADAKAKADEDARLLAEKEAAEKAAKEKEEADKKAAEDAKKRPRGTGNRPTGRGFVLA